MSRDPLHLVLFLVPLFVIGFGAGAIRAVSLRPGLPPERKRLLTAAWVAVLLAGGPLWLFLAATLG
ncbi:MAG TPA: hypothetical protein VD838_02220, partial [Anaeromyxobacteraceae bacterium]|nr:hypothetical protein [Anaeromyxobacteraceae bacterium]